MSETGDDTRVDEEQLAAELALATVELDADEHERVAVVATAVANELGRVPPLGMLADLVALLGRPGLPARRAAQVEVGPLRDALLRYDDDVLARLGLEPLLLAVRDAIAALTPARRGAAMALVAVHLIDRLDVAGGEVPPLVLGRALRRSDRELAALAGARLGDDEWRESIADRMVSLARRARATRALLTPADVLLAQNVTALRDLGQRVALSQVADVAEAIDRALPVVLKRRAAHDGAHATRLEDESAYPVGGFASMATRGTLENLVTSELAGMDDDDAGADGLRGALGFDLFDLRWAHGELLYYVRDETVAVRERRAITLALDAGLVAARAKDPTLAWQRIMLVSGLVVAATHRIAALLETARLLVRVAVPEELADERALLALALREPIARGHVAVAAITGSDEALALAESDAERGASVLVEIGLDAAANGPSRSARGRQPRRGELLVDERPAMRWSDEVHSSPVDGDAWSAWIGAARTLVEGAC